MHISLIFFIRELQLEIKDEGTIKKVKIEDITAVYDYCQVEGMSFCISKFSVYLIVLNGYRFCDI